MRRSVSITLLLMLSFTLAAPLFADQIAHAHACCHRGGKHHCESMEDASEASASIHQLAGKCPCSSGSTALQYVHDFGPRPAQAVYAQVLTHAAAIVQTHACYRISFNRSQQKRGPPSFLS